MKVSRLQKRSQLPLDLKTPPDFKPDRFVLSKSNREAWTALLYDPKPSHKIIALVGPEGSGKSHLASIWREKHDAVFLNNKDFMGNSIPDFHTYREQSLVLEDIDSLACKPLWEENLFHLLNFAVESTCRGLLLTTRSMPASWGVSMPDMVSRLRVLPVAQLEEPDDNLLEEVLKKMLSDRDLQASEAMLSYAIKRMERSMMAARVLVERLDRLAMTDKTRLLTRDDVRACLKEDNCPG